MKSQARDGALVVVSRDLRTATRADAIAPSLLSALQDWHRCEPELRRLEEALEAGRALAFAFDPTGCAAPLPCAPQWLDGSTYLNHARLMERAFNSPEAADSLTLPMMYQGASDDMLGPCEDFHTVSEEHGIDFEAEFGVIVDDTPMGCTAEAAAAHIKLLVVINDWSLRSFAAYEMRRGFGWLHAKPATSFAPIALTPDVLGPEGWRDHRPHLSMHVAWNGSAFGHPHGGEMHFSFCELIAHAARTRRLRAGTVIGSGTVSNADQAAGSACISELRAIEMIRTGEPQTGFMRFGDQVRIWAEDAHGVVPFGEILQAVARAT